jgi:hypothetical protein
VYGWLAVDPVHFEPVSRAQLPANREIYREFATEAAARPAAKGRKRLAVGHCRCFRGEKDQGVLATGTGSIGTGTGSSWRRIGSNERLKQGWSDRAEKVAAKGDELQPRLPGIPVGPTEAVGHLGGVRSSLTRADACPGLSRLRPGASVRTAFGGRAGGLVRV